VTVFSAMLNSTPEGNSTGLFATRDIVLTY